MFVAPQVVLPVVTQTGCHREDGRHSNLVLDESTYFSLLVNISGLSLLDRKLRGLARLIVLKRRRHQRSVCRVRGPEDVGTRRVGAVFEDAAVQIRYLCAELQVMPSFGPGNGVVDAQVVRGSHLIELRAAAGIVTLYGDLWALVDVRVGIVDTLKNDGSLVQA